MAGLLKEARERPATTLERAPEVRASEGVADWETEVLPRHVIARKLYVGIALLMVASLVVLGLAYRLVSDWRHGLLWIEGTLIVEFLCFWVVQTWELWNQTRRDSPPPDAPT